MAQTGKRYNKGKRKWSLVDFKALEPMCEVLEYGAHKYSIFENPDTGKQYTGLEISEEDVMKFGYKLISSGADNWKNGLPVVDMTESLLRHAFAMLRGEVNDPESGKSHIGHLMCNAMFITWTMENKPEFNNINHKHKK